MSVHGTGMASAGTRAPVFGSGKSAAAEFSGSSSLSAFGLRSHASSSGGEGGGVHADKTDVSNEAMSGVELKMAGISFEQARKLTMMAGWQARG